MNFLSFDIELALSLNFRGSWKNSPELVQIACCGAMASNFARPYIYHRQDYRSLSKLEAQGIVRQLEQWVANGYTIVTHNGHNFDFVALGLVSGLKERCRELSLGHVDMWLQINKATGKKIGVNQLGNAMDIGTKYDGMRGRDFPMYWGNGEYNKCLSYLAQDARLELGVARKALDEGKFDWGFGSLEIERLIKVKELT